MPKSEAKKPRVEQSQVRESMPADVPDVLLEGDSPSKQSSSFPPTTSTIASIKPFHLLSKTNTFADAHLPAGRMPIITAPSASSKPSASASDLPVSAPTPYDLPVSAPTPYDLPVSAPTPYGLPVSAPTPCDLPVSAPTPSDLPVSAPSPSDLPVTAPTPLTFQCQLHHPLTFQCQLQHPVTFQCQLQHPVTFQCQLQHPLTFQCQLQHPVIFQCQLHHPVDSLSPLQRLWKPPWVLLHCLLKSPPSHCQKEDSLRNAPIVPLLF
ncbi:hypothetical protein JZ751_001699 [Albula glossodonta]|uniref:Uncharacterized protein n=1 Tax=Albula glossodonta TaxID=121402 RepID=A0A8T2PUR0_9TELE|nr:hypothetical protein JZ751_001699 [Albula glossodonta]